jgi:hypothetical protein
MRPLLLLLACCRNSPATHDVFATIKIYLGLNGGQNGVTPQYVRLEITVI